MGGGPSHAHVGKIKKALIDIHRPGLGCISGKKYFRLVLQGNCFHRAFIHAHSAIGAGAGVDDGFIVAVHADRFGGASFHT